MNIKTEALRVFVVVADLGNIRDASAKLGRTPSAISMALKQLEENIGGTLFESDRKAKLTALGDYVLTLARSEVERHYRSVAAMRAFASNEIGRLDLQSVPSVASHLLPSIIARFIAERPGIELDLRDSDSLSVERALERDRVDLGIAGRPRSRGPILFEPLFRDRFVLVCSLDNPLTKKRNPLDWSDLEQQIFIQNGAAEALHSPAYSRLAAGSKLMVRNVTSLLGLVRSNVGVTFLPVLSVPRQDRKLKTLTVADDTLFREVGLLSREGRSLTPAATAFAELLRSELKTTLAGESDMHPI